LISVGQGRLAAGALRRTDAYEACGNARKHVNITAVLGLAAGAGRAHHVRGGPARPQQAHDDAAVLRALDRQPAGALRERPDGATSEGAAER